jgi:hypothetical protein
VVTTESGSGTWTLSSSCSSTLSRASTPCSSFFIRSSRSRTSACSSSKVAKPVDSAQVSSAAGQLALVDGGHGDGDLGRLTGVLPCDQRGGEGGGVTGALAEHGGVEALEQLAGADLVAQAGRRAAGHLGALDGGDQVEGEEVSVGGGRSTGLSLAKRSRSSST